MSFWLVKTIALMMIIFVTIGCYLLLLHASKWSWQFDNTWEGALPILWCYSYTWNYLFRESVFKWICHCFVLIGQQWIINFFSGNNYLKIISLKHQSSIFFMLSWIENHMLFTNMRVCLCQLFCTWNQEIFEVHAEGYSMAFVFFMIGTQFSSWIIYIPLS